jgi:hypothetical protein
MEKKIQNKSKAKPSGQTNVDYFSDVLELTVLIKPSTIADKVTIALGNYRWVDLPKEHVKHVKNLGNYLLLGENYPVYQLEIKRPTKDNLWWDMLYFMLERLISLWMEAHPEKCDCHCTEEPQRVQKAGGNRNTRTESGNQSRKKSRRSIASCVACWAMTMGDSNFCGWAGSCDY